MTDKELLELAAKAAGIKLDGMAMLPQRGWPINMESGYPWNPLTDDGDALRLAANLNLDVCWNENEGPWEVNAWPQGPGMGSAECPDEDHEGDHTAAMRRAIVRTAANIGKAMP